MGNWMVRCRRSTEIYFLFYVIAFLTDVTSADIRMYLFVRFTRYFSSFGFVFFVFFVIISALNHFGYDSFLKFLLSIFKIA